MEENKVVTTLEVPFKSGKEAEVAYHVLRVEKEPKRSGVMKSVTLRGQVLVATFKADSVRQIRVAVNGFFDSVLLVNETMDFTGPPVSDTYSH